MPRRSELRKTAHVRYVVPALALLLVSAAASTAPAQRTVFEDASITAISEGYIHVSAQSGDFVLEPVKPCFWCTVGMEVVLALKGYTSVKLEPKHRQAVRARPLRAYIVKDGRNEE
ncbi:MAG: hypothetical protein V1792_18135 [Pseudomonadota bacterium]